MQKLGQLRTFIEGLNQVDAHQVDAMADDITVTIRNSFKNGTLIVNQMRYTAIIEIKSWPHVNYPMPLLTAQLTAWMTEHNSAYIDSRDNEPARIAIDVTIIDDKLADLDISIDFEEDVTATEVADATTADFSAFNKHWRLGETPINIATGLGIVHADWTD